MLEVDISPNLQSETEKMVFSAANDFALQHIKDHVMEWDEIQYFPKELFEKAGKLGFTGMLIPEVYGGSGMGYLEYVAMIDAISRIDPTT